MTENQINKIETEIILRELSRIIKFEINGDVVEFGCYDGATSIHLINAIKRTDKKLYVYDSFEGLPDKSDYDSSPLGLQFKPGELYISKKQFVKNINRAKVSMPIIKKGWFSELRLDDIPSTISFAFLDGDYYESIKDSFKLIENKLSKGATIIIDDYGNSALPGAARAVDEWLKKHPKVIKKIEHSLAILYCN